MKSAFGRNQRWIVAAEHRAALRSMFVEVLGAEVAHATPTREIYRLSDGGSVGVFVEERSLGAEEARLGAWLEFLVEDVDAAVAGLERAGATRVDFFDQTHVYLQAPGGPVFRLAKLA